MEIETKNFGLIDIEEDKIINFVDNILGFEDYSKFTIIDSLDDDVFYWLQSAENPGLCFAMITPIDFIEDYKITLTDKFEERLELEQLEDIIVYTIVVIGNQGKYITTNLKAPIIINSKNRRAGQLVVQEDYPTKYYLLSEDSE
ncbi:flagellar assembly protein FliW [Orenia marismortui]|uniref:Flagellar assembly factor FliW n=1 Tax=Orenia marismortui TaxID=46469 RepID=A0A4V3H008_9FIRM|nr:flagellar assembly protein FliW [Orenia marismortui]TDX58899.1 flagellar assembly factor FliW [Orenia marismortui]